MPADMVGWRHAAGFGGPAEMPLPRKREEEFQLVDHDLYFRMRAQSTRPAAQVTARRLVVVDRVQRNKLRLIGIA